MSTYSIGTVTLENGSTAIVGSDTGWQTALVSGGVLYPEAAGNPLPIASVEGEEAATAAVKWRGASGTYAYAIVRDSSAAASIINLNDRAAQILIHRFIAGLIPAGDWSSAQVYVTGEYVQHGGRTFASLIEDNEDNEPPSADEDDANWMWIPVVNGQDSTVPGPAGEGFTPAGEWAIGTEYSTGDYVQFNDRTFVSLVDENTGNEPPDAEDDDAYWMWVPVVNGSDGTDGRTILSGTVDPTTEGEDGDFYIRTDNQHLFGPKASGTWPSGVDLNGTDGINGRTILSGAVDPTTEGENGDFYINTASQTLFGPKAAGDWPAGVALKGSDGVSFIWKGAYSGATAYDENDVVEDNGSSWIALQSTTGNAPPSLPTTSNAYWEIMTKAGADGLGAGTVTSVAMSVPTGLAVSGSPITTSGTLAVTYDTGYQGYTSNEASKLSGIEAAADVTDAGNVGSSIHGASGKTTPVDADTVPLIDSAASNVLKKVTWANIKATLKTYFDTLYQPLLATLTSWGAITRAAGFDTFTATPSSANLRSLLTDETGTGAAVFATSPAIATPTLTDPSITGCILEDIYTITDGAAFEIDPSNGSIQFVTLGANRTPAATNFQNGESVTLRIADGTAYTITWSTVGVVWKGGSAPTLATSGYTEIHLEKAGGVIRGVHVGDFAS